MDVRKAVEHIQRIPGAYVDCSFRQGRDKVLKQLNERSGRDEKDLLDASIRDIQNTIVELIQEAAPYHIPDDYIFFLEFYGGLAIDKDNYRFSVFGVGPMVEEWYASVVSDVAFSEPGKSGVLSLGRMSFRTGEYQFQYVTFFLDLAGILQENCVIGIGPWGKEELTSFTIIKDIHAYPGMWRKIANSFTEWLEQTSETQGSFNYI